MKAGKTHQGIVDSYVYSRWFFFTKKLLYNNAMKIKNVKVYALSTCGWCRKTVAWLKENGVKSEIIYIDLIENETEKEKIRAQVRKHNPLVSFPTVVINDGEYAIVGYQPEKMREVCKK